ncbi:MAG: hypothetical protein ABIJ57_03405 [Pseudomonadota bacterium]
MNDLSECCLAPMEVKDNSDGAFYICSECLQPCCPVGDVEE